MGRVSNQAEHDGPGGSDGRPPAQVPFDFEAICEPAPLPGEHPPTTDQFEDAAAPATTSHDELPQAPFGEWLLNQKDRKGWIGDLAKAAKADRDFPKRGGPDDVRKRMQQLGADGDAFEAVDDAELDWASL